jgi:hypothetical protein
MTVCVFFKYLDQKWISPLQSPEDCPWYLTHVLTQVTWGVSIPLYPRFLSLFFYKNSTLSELQGCQS